MSHEQELPIRPTLRAGHQQALAAIASPGTWWTGEQRVAIVNEARHALDCDLCLRRKVALSPYQTDGTHNHATDLPDNLVEVIHRIRTDSGRVTRQWFDKVLATGLSAEAYVETVGLIAMSLVLDTFADGCGNAWLVLPNPVAGDPTRLKNGDVIDAGAWVPLTRVEVEDTAFGLPRAPNIARAMGLVPGAVADFFGVFRPHYALANLEFDISRAQVEMIASRVSSHNECFY